MEQTNLKENVELQREYLKNNLEQLNTVVSAVVGVRVNLEIKEYTNYRKEIRLGLEDNHNFRGVCGIMARAFKEVTIGNFGMWWKEDGVTFDLHFHYEHISGGSNGAQLCTINITNNFVKIL